MSAFVGGLIRLLRKKDGRFQEAHRVAQALHAPHYSTYNKYIARTTAPKNGGTYDIYSIHRCTFRSTLPGVPPVSVSLGSPLRKFCSCPIDH